MTNAALQLDQESSPAKSSIPNNSNKQESSESVTTASKQSHVSSQPPLLPFSNNNNPFLTITPAQSPAIGGSGGESVDAGETNGAVLPPGVESVESFRNLLSQTFPELSDLNSSSMPPPPETLFVNDPVRSAKFQLQQHQEEQERRHHQSAESSLLNSPENASIHTSNINADHLSKIRRSQSLPVLTIQQQQQHQQQPPTPPPLPHSRHLLPSMLAPLHPPLHPMYPRPNDPAFMNAYMQHQYRQQMMARHFQQQQQQQQINSSSNLVRYQLQQQQQQQGAGSASPPLAASSLRSMPMMPPPPISTSQMSGRGPLSGVGGGSSLVHSPSLPHTPLSSSFMNTHPFSDLMLSPDPFMPLSPVDQHQPQHHQFPMHFPPQQQSQQQQFLHHRPSNSSLMHPYHYQQHQVASQKQQHEFQMQHPSFSQAHLMEKTSNHTTSKPLQNEPAVRRQLPLKLPSSIKFEKNVDTSNLPEQTISMLAAMAPPEPAVPAQPLTPEEEEQQNLAKILERPAYHPRPVGQPQNVNMGSRVEPASIFPRFKCACSKHFQKLCGLKSHIKVHRSHGERLKYDENNVLRWYDEKGELVASSPDELARSFSCEHCKKSFLRRQDLRRHIMSSHSGTVKKLHCPNCDGTFSRSDALYRHINSNRCRV